MMVAPMMRPGETVADDQWLSKFVQVRDEAAFERLVVRYGPMVLRVCRDVLGDQADAEDAFQATFLVLFRQAHAIRNHDSVGCWLYEVAGRVARRARNGDSKRRTQERRAWAMESVSSADHQATDREWRSILHEEIQSLPAKLRDAVVLCYLEGLTVEAAARQLGCPTATLKSRLGKGRELLRSRLTRRGLAASAVLLLLFWFEESSQAMSQVPEPLLRSTIAAALGDPAAIPRGVQALLLGEEPTPWLGSSRLWVALILILALLGGIRWSLAIATADTPTLSVVQLATQDRFELSRWLPFGLGQPASPPRQCRLPH